MSTDDPHRPNASLPDSAPNPYSVPNADPGQVQQFGPIPLPANQTRGMVNQAVIVGVLMVVQGAINAVFAVVVGLYAAFMPYLFEELAQEQAANGETPMPEEVGLYVAIGGGAVALVLLGLGALLVYSGISVANYKHRTLAIISLMSGLVTLFTCYCFPTSLLLGIYGMIFLFNQPVALAFELRGKGYSSQDIQKSFLSLP